MRKIVNGLQQICLACSVASENVVETLVRTKFELPIVSEISKGQGGKAQGIFSGTGTSEL